MQRQLLVTVQSSALVFRQPVQTRNLSVSLHLRLLCPPHAGSSRNWASLTRMVRLLWSVWHPRVIVPCPSD